MEVRSKVKLTWEVVELLCTQIAHDIEDSGIVYDGILGIARGGLIPAVLIAGVLGVRDVKTIQLSRYHEGVPGEVKGIASNDPLLLCGKWLAVDDIIGTGETLEAVKTMYPTVDTCAVLARPGWNHDPTSMRTFVGKVLPEGQGWIEFPWEMLRTVDGAQREISEGERNRVLASLVERN